MRRTPKYAAVTKDEAQRRRWTFYEAVKKKNRYQVRPDNGSLWISVLLRHYQAVASKFNDLDKEEQ
jgi:hypothetical protein